MTPVFARPKADMSLTQHNLFVKFLFVEQLLSGKSQGPDPNDVPPVAVQGLSMASGAAASMQECGTIEEEDSSEYEESSDEQQ